MNEGKLFSNLLSIKFLMRIVLINTYLIGLVGFHGLRLVEHLGDVRKEVEKEKNMDSDTAINTVNYNTLEVIT